MKASLTSLLSRFWNQLAPHCTTSLGRSLATSLLSSLSRSVQVVDIAGEVSKTQVDYASEPNATSAPAVGYLLRHGSLGGGRMIPL